MEEEGAFTLETWHSETTRKEWETFTLILFLLTSKSKFPNRDADRYSTIEPLPGGNQNSTSSTNCLAHVNAIRASS